MTKKKNTMLVKASCSGCEEIFEESELTYFRKANERLCDSCEPDRVHDDKLEAPITAVYNGEDIRRTVGYFHDDTMGDFDFEWQGEGYRGHYNVIPSGSWINVIDDNILAYSGDEADLKEFSDILEKAMQENHIQYAIIYSRSSNLFSTGYDMFIKKRHFKKYQLLKERIESIKKILRDPKKYHDTAITGETPQTHEDQLKADELTLAIGLLEQGLSPEEAVAHVKGYENYLNDKGIKPSEVEK